MRLNLAGWKALATTRVVFRHFHADRHWRPNTADTGTGLQRSLDRFREKWGCDRLAPDLAEVWRRWKDTPLVGRACLRGPRSWEPSESGDLPAGAEWERFSTDPALQASIAAELAALRAGDGPIAVLGSRSGLSSFLRARDGVEVAAVEEHAASAAKLEEMSKTSSNTTMYLSSIGVDDLSSTNLRPRAFKIVALLDSAERYWNPVGLLRESRRLLAADGLLVVRSRARASRFESRGKSLHLFAAHELLQIVRHVGGFTPLGPPTLDGNGRWQLLARSSSSTAHSLHFGA